MCAQAMRHSVSQRMLMHSTKRSLCSAKSSIAYNITSHQTAKLHNFTNNAIIARPLEHHRYNNFIGPTLFARSYARGSSGWERASNDDGGKNDDDDDWSEWDEYSDDGVDDKQQEGDLPATVTVPEFFPDVPLLTTNQPVFPKFVKVLEVREQVRKEEVTQINLLSFVLNRSAIRI